MMTLSQFAQSLVHLDLPIHRRGEESEFILVIVTLISPTQHHPSVQRLAFGTLGKDTTARREPHRDGEIRWQQLTRKDRSTDISRFCDFLSSSCCSSIQKYRVIRDGST